MDSPRAAGHPKLFWYGDPVRSLDSTDIGRGMSFALLPARLYQLTGDESLRENAITTAAAFVSPQGYGRTVDSKTLIQCTRDPHSDGMWADLFAAEVLPLAGMLAAVVQAFIDTGAYIAANCLTSDGFLTADWAGPEANPVAKRSSWDQDYAADPGSKAGHEQIMTTANTLSMLQARACVASWLPATSPAPLAPGAIDA